MNARFLLAILTCTAGFLVPVVVIAEVFGTNTQVAHSGPEAVHQLIGFALGMVTAFLSTTLAALILRRGRQRRNMGFGATLAQLIQSERRQRASRERRDNQRPGGAAHAV